MSKQTGDNSKVVITKDERRVNGWVKGEVHGEPAGKISFEAKVFDEGSMYGINKGRVSKLDIRQDRKVLVNYDRGWDVKPQTPEVKAVYKKIMAAMNALDKVFELDADKPKDLLGKIEANKQKAAANPPSKQEKSKGEELC